MSSEKLPEKEIQFAEPSGTLSIPHSYTLLCSTDTEAYMVPVSQWSRYVARIKASADQSNRFDSAGWGLLGIGAGVLAAAVGFYFTLDFEIQLPGGTTKANIPAFSIAWGFFFCGLASLIGGGTCLFFAYLHSNDKAASREGIFEDMTAFAANCKRVPIPQDKSA